MAKVGSQKKPAARQARHLSLSVCCSSLSLLFEFLSVPRQAPVSKKAAAKLAAEAVKVVKERPATSTTQIGQAPKSSSASRKTPWRLLQRRQPRGQPTPWRLRQRRQSRRGQPPPWRLRQRRRGHPPWRTCRRDSLYIYIKLSPLHPYIGLVNPSFCAETDLQEEDSGLEATWEACQGAEAAFQARGAKPEPGQGKPEPGNDGLGLV